MQDFNFDDIDELLEKEVEKEEKVEQPKTNNSFSFGGEDTGSKPIEINVDPEPKKVNKKPEIIDTPKVDESKKASEQPKANQTSVAVKKDSNYLLVENVLGKIVQQNGLTEETFTNKDKAIASDIIIMTAKAVKTNGYKWDQIDLISNNYTGDIKRWARLGVDSHDYLYPDFKRNSKTGLVDLKIKAQYQTIEKLITKYCKKEVFAFYTDVICTDDVFEASFDFASGQYKVTKHTKAENRNPNSLDDIKGAYKIAYVREKNGEVVQLLCQIDKNRIMRAYNSAQTKNVWNNDTQKMVKKTVTWEMWNSEVIRPFMDFPYELEEDLSVVNESSDVDFSNKDHKFKDVDSADTNAKNTFNSGDVIDVEL